MLVCLSVGQLNGSYATEVEEVPGNLVVGSVRGKLCLCDEQVGLCDIGGGNVISEKQRGNGRLRIGVFAEDSASESSEQLSTDVDDL